MELLLTILAASVMTGLAWVVLDLAALAERPRPPAPRHKEPAPVLSLPAGPADHAGDDTADPHTETPPASRAA